MLVARTPRAHSFCHPCPASERTANCGLSRCSVQAVYGFPLSGGYTKLFTRCIDLIMCSLLPWHRNYTIDFAQVLARMPIMSKIKTLTDQIRDAVKASKLSHYRLCKETGIDKASMSKFMSGQRDGLSMEALNKLAALLKLRIVVDRKDG